MTYGYSNNCSCNNYYNNNDCDCATPYEENLCVEERAGRSSNDGCNCGVLLFIIAVILIFWK